MITLHNISSYNNYISLHNNNAIQSPHTVSLRPSRAVLRSKTSSPKRDSDLATRSCSMPTSDWVTLHRLEAASDWLSTRASRSLIAEIFCPPESCKAKHDQYWVHRLRPRLIGSPLGPAAHSSQRSSAPRVLQSRNGPILNVQYQRKLKNASVEYQQIYQRIALNTNEECFYM
jgi:hypothetical protein